MFPRESFESRLLPTSLLARRLGTLELQLIANPAYLRKEGEPKTCESLSRHSCIQFTGEGRSDYWELEGSRGSKHVKINGRASADTMSVVRELTLAGQGIALIPVFLCEKELKSGRLRRVLPEWAQNSGPVHAVYPGQKLVLPKVRAFLELMFDPNQGREWQMLKRSSRAT